MALGPELLAEFEITDRAKAILAQAVVDAARRGAAAAEPEDVLRGILVEGNGISCVALDRLGVDRGALLPVGSPVPIGPPPGSRRQPGPDLPLGLLRAANVEATALGHRYVGTEHLLLALAGSQHPVVARRLAEHGVTLAAARATIAALLGRQLPAR